MPPTPIAKLDVDITHKGQMVMDLSSYTVDSLISVVQDKGIFDFVLDGNTFDGAGKAYLTTTIMDGFLPGIVAKYGKGVPVALRFRTEKAPQSQFNVDQIGAKMSAKIDFIVNGNETAVALAITDADATVSPSLTNFTLFMQIVKFDVKAISVLAS